MNTICSAMRSMISHDGLTFFFHCLLLLERTFFFHYLLLLERTLGWVLYPSPCSFLFALHLDWFLNTSVDKKIKCSFNICEFVFYFSLWFKLSIFFSLALFSLEMYNRSGKKLTRKNLNVDRLFFKDVLCVTLLQKGEGEGQYQF